MNRLKSDNRPSFPFPFVALILAFVVATTGGAMHAIYRNGQIQTEHKISQTKQRIQEHRRDIQMIEVRRERLIDRYEIRESLERLGSDLVPVTHGVVETVRPLPDETPQPVASRS